VAHGVEEVAFLALARGHREAARRLLADVAVVVLEELGREVFDEARGSERRERRRGPLPEGPRMFSGSSLKSVLSARKPASGR
jgi:hypothetical protein